MSGSKRRWNPTSTGTDAASISVTSADIACRSPAIGFSHNTGVAAARHARTRSGCVSVGVATSTPSLCARRSASSGTARELGRVAARSARPAIGS
jgi:hypothetical protein